MPMRDTTNAKREAAPRAGCELDAMTAMVMAGERGLPQQIVRYEQDTQMAMALTKTGARAAGGVLVVARAAAGGGGGGEPPRGSVHPRRTGGGRAAQ